MAYKEQLLRLNQEAWFQKFTETELLAATPQVPAYNPQSDNTDRWKYDSAMREGYLLCLRKLGVSQK